MKTAPLSLALGLSAGLLAPSASAFCGFYVAGADSKLYSDATQVALMREGTRTAITMQNDYRGPPEAFALVVPVPVVLEKEQVKTLPRDVFDKLDKLSAPRLVEYWEQDPCAPNVPGFGMGSVGLGLAGIGGLGHGSGGGHGVTVEARFTVGEYAIVILSATDASGLDAWLREQKYAIPEGAEPYLRPYVQRGMKFFVAKVDPSKVTFEAGRAALSPLRFHYDSEELSLPVRLGLINSSGTQDLLVYILAKGTRYDVANYEGITIPTNLDVSEATRGRFGEMYGALFDSAVKGNPRAVVTEYAWDAASCDPCPGPTLDGEDLATLGADVMPSGAEVPVSGALGVGVSAPRSGLRETGMAVGPGLPKEIVRRITRQSFGRYQRCYDAALKTAPTLSGSVTFDFSIAADGNLSNFTLKGGALPDNTMRECVAKVARGVRFPNPEKAPVKVSYSVVFTPPGASSGGFSPGPPSAYVLTRLHARYGRDSLGEDLIFKEAPPIAGGREVRGAEGLEIGSIPAERNNFQARYAIRHPWLGPVACETPVRGRWGGPPPSDAGVVEKPAPLAAQKVGLAARGAIRLEDFLPGGVPATVPAEAQPAPSVVSAADGGPGGGSGVTTGGDGSAAPPSSKGCGSCSIGAPARPPVSSLASLVGAMALAFFGRRRASRAPLA